MIADVSDKGMPAALFMALTRSTVRASVGHAASPAEGIALANRLLCADSTGGMFVTLFYAQLDPASGEMCYVNAGHNPPLLCPGGSPDAPSQRTELTRTGMALGVLEDAPFEQRIVQIDPGDSVFLYTDGVTEAMDAQGQAFDTVRLLRVLDEQDHAPAGQLLDAIEQALRKYVGETPQADDVTLVAVSRALGPVS